MGFWTEKCPHCGKEIWVETEDWYGGDHAPDGLGHTTVSLKKPRVPIPSVKDMSKLGEPQSSASKVKQND